MAGLQKKKNVKNSSLKKKNGQKQVKSRVAVKKEKERKKEK